MGHIHRGCDSIVCAILYTRERFGGYWNLMVSTDFVGYWVRLRQGTHIFLSHGGGFVLLLNKVLTDMERRGEFLMELWHILGIVMEGECSIK